MENPVTIICDVPATAGGIWPIIFAAPPTLETGAPERFEELLSAISGLTIHLQDSDEFQAYANSGQRRITITRALAECLWCASYAYFAFRLEIEQQMEGDGPHRFVLSAEDSPEVANGARALEEAVRAASTETPVCWDGLPTPVSPALVSAESSLEAKAGEMALSALSFALHHELAHVRLGHCAASGNPAWSLDQEKEADAAAIEWLLGRAPEDRPAAIAKRAFGVAIVTCFMTAKRLEAQRLGRVPKPVEEQTHPQPYDRLDRAVRHEAVQRSAALIDTMTGLACACLVPHVRVHELALGDGPYQDYAELYDALLDLLSDQLVR